MGATGNVRLGWAGRRGKGVVLSLGLCCFVLGGV